MEKQREESQEETSEAKGGPPQATLDFLHSSGLSQIGHKHNISFKHHANYPNVVCLHYNRVNTSSFDSAVVEECRGLVLDTANSNGIEVLAFPFRKFFNYNESEAHKIDWSTAKVFHKIDGTLMTLYYYAKTKEWFVASSSFPDASGSIVNSHHKQTFASLFWSLFKKKNYSYPKPEDNCCYMFEMFSKEAPVLVKPQKETLTLVGVRQIKDQFLELNPIPIAKKYNWEYAQPIQSNEVKFSSIQDVVELAKTLNPGVAEGFVVCDFQFSRVKVKCPGYVAISLLSVEDKGHTNQRRMLSIVTLNEGSEYLSYFPQWKNLHDELKQKYLLFCDDVEKKIKAGTTMTEQEKKDKNCRSLYKECEEALKLNTATSVKEYYSSIRAKDLEQLMTEAGFLKQRETREPRGRGRGRGRGR